MATLTYSKSLSVSGSVKTNLYLSFAISDINNKAAEIPPFSKINSCKLNYKFKRATSIASSSKGYHYVWYGNNEDDYDEGSVYYLDKQNVQNNTECNRTLDILNAVARNENGAGYRAGKLEPGKTYIMFWSTYYYTWKQTVSADITVTWDYSTPYAKVTVNGGTGSGTYAYNTSYTITATPPAGHEFVKWSDGDTNKSRTISVSSVLNTYETVKTYTAEFRKLTYTATFKNWDGTVLKTQSVEYGSTPTAPSNPTRVQDSQYTYTFSGWSPSVSAITGNITYTAQYTATVRKYTISTSVSPSGSGTVSGGGSYDYNSKPTLVATPASGYKFLKWNDGVTTASRTITVTESVTYTAYFEKIPPKFTSAEMRYIDKPISPSNKVICNEGYIISVGVI